LVDHSPIIGRPQEVREMTSFFKDYRLNELCEEEAIELKTCFTPVKTAQEAQKELTRHGKYKDQEKRKASKREWMRSFRAKGKALKLVSPAEIEAANSEKLKTLDNIG
jgi:hypothetical protein